MPPLPSPTSVRDWLRLRALHLATAARFHWPGLALASAALVVYAYARERQAYGCDSWAYVAQARMMRGADVGLSGGLDPERFPALLPLCAELAGRNIVPGMPPGFSVALAVGGLFRLETMTSPIIGALTVFLVYLGSHRKAGRPIAVLVALLWAACPIAIWGGTHVMGDLSAACALLLSYVLLDRNRGSAAGFVFGFSSGIRPTNALFAVAALAKLGDWRQLRRFAAGSATGFGLWAAFGIGRFGGSRMFGMYGGNTRHVDYAEWRHQLGFIATTTACLFPLLLVAGALAVARDWRARLPLLLWPVAILAFYVGWNVQYDAWWWARHVLPAYPAIALLGALGLRDISDWLSTRGRLAWASLAVGAALNVAGGLWFANGKGLLSNESRDLWLRDVADLKAELPRNALVGGVNFSGALRMYAGIESFRWDHPGAPELIDYAVKSGRPVYLLIEPRWFDERPAALALRARYRLTDVKQMRALGTVLRKVEPSERLQSQLAHAEVR